MRRLLLAALISAAVPARARAQTLIVKHDGGLSRAERLDVRRDAGVRFRAAPALPDIAFTVR